MRQSIETSLAPGAGHLSRPEPHRLDELSAGYSLAGCSPAAPASAFPADSEYGNRVARKSTIFQRTATVPLCCCLSLGVHAIDLVVVAELFVPVLDHLDRGLFNLSQRLGENKLLAVFRDVVTVSSSYESRLFKQAGRRAHRKLRSCRDRNGHRRTSLGIKEFLAVSAPAWLGSAVGRYCRLALPLGKRPDVDFGLT